MLCLYDTHAADRLRQLIPGVRVLSGLEGLREIASMEKADFVLAAISGAAGLLPTYEAVRAGKTIGLANKETLVVAGEIVMKTLKEKHARLLPVDSEHNAVFQCLEGRSLSDVKNIYLTASGGPFRKATVDDIKKATPTDALNHPTWQMGKKITIDSATLMNKGLEVIEACHLFGFSPDQVKVLIHPQSIVHCIVEFVDGGMIAQMAVPDMKGPIAHAMAWPDRLEGVLPHCSLPDKGPLEFEEPDQERFPCLRLAYEALKEGGTAPAVLNAANEVAVEAFLNRRISFIDIPVIIERVLYEHKAEPATSIETVLKADRWARERSKKLLEEQ